MEYDKKRMSHSEHVSQSLSIFISGYIQTPEEPEIEPEVKPEEDESKPEVVNRKRCSISVPKTEQIIEYSEDPDDELEENQEKKSFWKPDALPTKELVQPIRIEYFFVGSRFPEKLFFVVS